MDNAFDPTNEHLWVRCKTHETSAIRPKFCVFVENCPECKDNCFHDADEKTQIHAMIVASSLT